MTLRKAFIRTLVVSAVALGMLTFGAPAQAHWNPDKGHKMHFPQLPDSAGWDVNGTQGGFVCLADDWTCSETGMVTDIHVWGSWKDGIVGQLDFC